jgi:hypothetical protein
MTWTRSLEETAVVRAAATTVFAWLDEPRNTGFHMNRPSLAMLGGALRLERVSAQTRGVGATYRSWGRVLGLPIDFTTAVTQWVPGREKTWRTVGKPRLIVLGDFQMRFSLASRDGGTNVMMAIDYSLPTRGIGRLVGAVLAAPYARWCLRRMVRDARSTLDSNRARERP